MEESSKIDLSVLSTIDKLINNCQENEDWWAKNELKPLENNFASFHAFRNIRLILKKIEERLSTAKERGSNPGEVENALFVIPALSSLYEYVSALKGKSIDYNIKNTIYLRSRNVRSIAANYYFLPNLEEEIVGINKTKLRNRISHLSKTVQEDVEI